MTKYINYKIIIKYKFITMSSGGFAINSYNNSSNFNNSIRGSSNEISSSSTPLLSSSQNNNNSQIGDSSSMGVEMTTPDSGQISNAEFYCDAKYKPYKSALNMFSEEYMLKVKERMNKFVVPENHVRFLRKQGNIFKWALGVSYICLKEKETLIWQCCCSDECLNNVDSIGTVRMSK